jgi:hypothetical protein
MRCGSNHVDILRILQAVEELIYEVALWVVFIPKTFFKVVLHPHWCHSYITDEFQKNSKERFEAYISPVLFWVTTGVVPYLFVIDYLRWVKQSRVAQEVEFSNFLGFPWATRLLVVAMFALGGPLGFSLLIQKAKRTLVTRELFRRTFYVQCYCFTPATLFLLPLVAVTLRFNDDIPGGWVETVFGLSFLVFVCWLFYAEVILIRAELDVGWFQAVARFIAYSFASYCLTFFLELIVITLTQGVQIWQ